VRDALLCSVSCRLLYSSRLSAAPRLGPSSQHALEEKLLQDLNDVAQLQARVDAERTQLEQEREYLKTYKENRAAAEAWHRDLHRTRVRFSFFGSLNVYFTTNPVRSPRSSFGARSCTRCCEPRAGPGGSTRRPIRSGKRRPTCSAT